MNTLWGWGRASWAGCGPDVRRGGQTLIMGYSADKSPLIGHLAGPLRRLEPLVAQRQEKCGPNRPTPTGYSCNNAAFRRHREVVEIPDTPTFDLVVARQVLEHVAAPLAILRSLALATHPGGFVVISVPNLDGMHKHGDRAYCLRSKTHVMAYSSTCLEYLLNAAGFDLVSVEELDGSRKMAVIGQRVDPAPMYRPVAPLAAALTALARYDARQGSGPTGGSPVRLQAAMLNWSRSLRGHRPRG